MKKAILLLVVALFLMSCVDKSPGINEEDYRLAQKEYEALKTKLSVDKDAFYEENKETLMEKINLFRRLKDSTTVFKSVNKDENFTLDGVTLHSINFKPSKASSGGSRIVFLSKEDREFMRSPFREKYKMLYWCETIGEHDTCKSIESEILQDFLDVKYVFVVDGYRFMEPTLKDKDNFESGLFIASILVYDIDKNAPLYQYSVTATNSDEVSYMKSNYFNQNLLDVVKRDFEDNIEKSIWDSTRKHFNTTYGF